MIYLSQVINKTIKHGNKSYGKVVDLIVSENKQDPFISKVLVKQSGKKLAIQSNALKFDDNKWHMKGDDVNILPYDEKDFFLVEDLLDKQVIDINGRRLVRVNDVVLINNGEMKVEGIDIGFSGILRRLGLPIFMSARSITLPWSLLEAFDYQTGNIQIKLTQSKLNSFHPAEIADILEEAGSKERVGLMKALDAENAASALSKTDEETQSAILEEVPSTNLKRIVERMHSSEIADVLNKLNPFTSNQILTTLESEKAKRVKKLLIFEEDEAGGLMDFSFYKEKGTKSIGETLSFLAENDIRPEIIVVIGAKGELLGTVHIKNLINRQHDLPLKELIKQHYFVFEDASFSKILKLFAEYNLRILPVVDHDKIVIGVISIESVLSKIQEEEEKEDVI
jgi:magnesium transporter